MFNKTNESLGLNISSQQCLCVYVHSQIYCNRFGCMFALVLSVPGASDLQPGVVNTCRAGLTVLSQISENNTSSLTCSWFSRAVKATGCVSESHTGLLTWSITHKNPLTSDLNLMSAACVDPRALRVYVKPGFAFTWQWSVRKIELLSICAAEVRSV